jgi:hypothetical protein
MRALWSDCISSPGPVLILVSALGARRSDDEFVGQWDGGAAQRGVGGGKQVRLRSDADEFRGLDQAVEQRCDLGATA